MSQSSDKNDSIQFSNSQKSNDEASKDQTNDPQLEKPKPLKPEEKPFEKFIHENLIPDLSKAIQQRGIPVISLTLKKGSRPVVGGECSYVYGEIEPGRRFWLAFNADEISSGKTISLAETGSEPDTLEAFLIDEKKTTLALLISRTLQRLNGQKWLGPN